MRGEAHLGVQRPRARVLLLHLQPGRRGPSASARRASAAITVVARPSRRRAGSTSTAANPAHRPSTTHRPIAAGVPPSGPGTDANHTDGASPLPASPERGDPPASTFRAASPTPLRPYRASHAASASRASTTPVGSARSATGASPPIHS